MISNKCFDLNQKKCGEKSSRNFWNFFSVDFENKWTILFFDFNEKKRRV